MLTFLSANLPTIAVGLVVFLAVAGAVTKIVLDKKNHKSSCGGCSGCCGGCSSGCNSK